MSTVPRKSFWRHGVFRLAAAACLLFIVLTVIAMLLYPGGAVGDPQSQAYSFFRNFFSDLGQTRTHSGEPNFPSMVLLVTALATVAIGLSLFFLAFTQFFAGPPIPRWLSRLGAVLGITTSICFIGVAATPWNLYLKLHNVFVMWAFRSLLAAVLLNLLAILFTPGFPRRFAWVFGAFAGLLAGYVLLLTFGPAPNTPQGAMVQATGQKIIVYASILTILLQALNVRSLLRTGAGQ